MKKAYHEIWGGSPKHDAVPELFRSGWEAATENAEGWRGEAYDMGYNHGRIDGRNEKLSKA